MARSLHPIAHGGIIYEPYLSAKNILIIRKIMQDSGMEREVTFDNLPQEVKDKILKELEK